ncbi:glycosyl transferase [Bradyrhizobium sp.]|uniref:glycosyl transferase n=1 Tax=Bradyrhizobium sp. TaxID=376 RepID=UPI0025BC4796|nr:glycosyl transferase [Bradyrhizobium sp.]
MANSQLALSFATAAAAGLLSGVMIWAIRPLLLQIALAQPNARSSHRDPTPQGAGVAVITATLTAAVAAVALAGSAGATIPFPVFAATVLIAVVGLADDIRSIPVLPRFLLQGVAVAAVILAAPENLRIVASGPIWLERAVLVLAGLWFVNLVNFMDGLDLMTAAEMVPITGAVVLLGWLGILPASTTLAAAALCGALLGFVPFNRPVAKIFLGDVGSLPIGLLVGWCLLQLAWHQQIAAALLLPLYYLADATFTLLRRMARGERFWTAHRTHFYQRATDNGFSVWRVVGEVFALNVGLAALATGAVMTSSAAISSLLLVVGGIATALVMYRFSRRQASPT